MQQVLQAPAPFGGTNPHLYRFELMGTPDNVSRVLALTNLSSDLILGVMHQGVLETLRFGPAIYTLNHQRVILQTQPL